MADPATKKWYQRKPRLGQQNKTLKSQRRRGGKLNRILELVPPEGVPLEFQLATLGQRFGAQLTDIFFTLLVAILLIAFLAYATQGGGTLLSIVFALTIFFIRVPYYIITELIWNGRTLAKRWLGLRVISLNGRSLGAHQIVVRNIMREVEIFAPLTYLIVGENMPMTIYILALVWTGIVIIVPWRSKTNQRIGDIIANTVVICDPKLVLLRDMAAGVQDTSTDGERFPFTTHHLDHYGRYELQVLERVLRSDARKNAETGSEQVDHLADIVAKITAKIQYPETIAPLDQEEFLGSFYRAQRAHLEQRKLFGDAREDKNFRDEI